MDRREALKSLALTTGAVISSSALMTVFTSSQSQAKDATKTQWQPLFFKPSEAATVSAIADIILPKTDTPAASEVQVPQFIDLLFKDILDEKEQLKFIAGLTLFNNKFKSESGEAFASASDDARKTFVEQTYALNESETSNVLELVRKSREDVEDKNKYDLWSFLVTMREMTIAAYFTSEFVGEKVLNYDPVPGVYKSCVPLEEIGNAWSI